MALIPPDFGASSGVPEDGALSTGVVGDDTFSFDYNRTVIGYHGTRRRTAEALVRGESFKASENHDDWLGHGIYFWEYAPRQAWWWAERRYNHEEPAVVGAMIRLGHCLDFLDPPAGEFWSGRMQKSLKRSPSRAGRFRRMPIITNIWIVLS